ncbi:hypothetical protein BC829DRAFT_303433 [Chytridium lagenaria]|nr:hypothetical protein BC829DRAFT_303433 [Chytridium lagenaria]
MWLALREYSSFEKIPYVLTSMRSKTTLACSSSILSLTKVNLEIFIDSSPTHPHWPSRRALKSLLHYRLSSSFTKARRRQTFFVSNSWSSSYQNFSHQTYSSHSTRSSLSQPPKPSDTELPQFLDWSLSGAHGEHQWQNREFEGGFDFKSLPEVQRLMEDSRSSMHAEMEKIEKALGEQWKGLDAAASRSSYQGYQRDFYDWCDRNFPNNLKLRYLVTENKMIMFLIQDVCNRRNKILSRIPAKISTYSACLSALNDLWKEQTLHIGNPGPNPRKSARIKTLSKIYEKFCAERDRKVLDTAHNTSQTLASLHQLLDTLNLNIVTQNNILDATTRDVAKLVSKLDAHLRRGDGPAHEQPHEPVVEESRRNIDLVNAVLEKVMKTVSAALNEGVTVLRDPEFVREVVADYMDASFQPTRRTITGAKLTSRAAECTSNSSQHASSPKAASKGFTFAHKKINTYVRP